MELIADGLLIATAMTAGLYCLVLSRRLRRLTDSGDGIGPQVEAFDRALAETRTALKETREGVLELRGSTKTVIAQLVRETRQGAETAERIEQGIEHANKTMQRLYEAGDRIEAHESRVAQATGGNGPAVQLEVPAGNGDSPMTDPDLGGEGLDGVSWSGDEPESGPAGPQVALPEGKLLNPSATPDASSPDTAGGRGRPVSGPVLKADRVML